MADRAIDPWEPVKFVVEWLVVLPRNLDLFVTGFLRQMYRAMRRFLSY